MPPRQRDEPTLRPDYDDGFDERATRRQLRSEFPADAFDLPGVNTGAWADTKAFVDAMHSRIVVEGQPGTLADLAAETSMTIRRIKESALASHHWFWTGAKERDGRPVTRVHGKKRQARRVLWAMYRKGAPDPKKVVHVTCERRECINPLHTDLMPRGSWQG